MSKVSITKSLLDELSRTIANKSGVAGPLTITRMNEIANELNTTAYVIGEPIDVTIPADSWDGTTAKVKVIGYLPVSSSSKLVTIGLPLNDSTVNTQRVIAATLTMPYVYYTDADTDDNVAAYTTLYLSAITAPTKDVTIGVFGLEEATTKVKVTQSAIEGIIVPVVGGTHTYSIDNEQYTGSISWSPTGTFAASTVYTATVTLTAKPGYKFTGISSNFFTVEGASKVTNSASSGVVTVVFPATEAS